MAELSQDLIDQFVGASHGDLGAVQTLLAQHPELLNAATRFGQLEMACWLLDHGATAGSLDYERKTPLQVARAAGHEDVAVLLRSRGARE